MSFKSIFVLVPETKNLLQCASRLIPTSATIEIWDEIAAKDEKTWARGILPPNGNWGETLWKALKRIPMFPIDISSSDAVFMNNLPFDCYHLNVCAVGWFDHVVDHIMASRMSAVQTKCLCAAHLNCYGGWEFQEVNLKFWGTWRGDRTGKVTVTCSISSKVRRYMIYLAWCWI